MAQQGLHRHDLRVARPHIRKHSDHSTGTREEPSELIRDTIESGQIVLVADTRTDQETSIARAVIQASVGDYKETRTV